MITSEKEYSNKYIRVKIVVGGRAGAWRQMADGALGGGG